MLNPFDISSRPSVDDIINTVENDAETRGNFTRNCYVKPVVKKDFTLEDEKIEALILKNVEELREEYMELLSDDDTMPTDEELYDQARNQVLAALKVYGK